LSYSKRNCLFQIGEKIEKSRGLGFGLSITLKIGYRLIKVPQEILMAWKSTSPSPAHCSPMLDTSAVPTHSKPLKTTVFQNAVLELFP
jgi:hypothetical protein